MASNCCRCVFGVVRRQPSPFSRLLGTGYYDGAIEGIVECASCRRLYSFHKLDWDDLQDVRVFSLAPVAGLGMEELVSASQGEEPRWPQWILMGEGSSELVQRIEAARARAAPDEFIVATEDLLDSLLVWRPVGLEAVSDWFTTLGLPRKAATNEEDK